MKRLTVLLFLFIAVKISFADTTALKRLHDQIEIMDVSSRIGETVFNDRGACVLFKVKNNSNESIIKLQITIFFLDRSGRPFFEDARFPVFYAPDSFSSSPTPLRPNYSITSSQCTTKGIDLNEWDEGHIRLEITDIEVEEAHRTEQKGEENFYVIKPGDTLRSIAQRELGNPNRATEILNLNAELFPAVIPRLKVGMRIRLPAK